MARKDEVKYEIVLDMDHIEGSLVALAAFRYALPRHSYIVGTISDWIIKNWDKFNDENKILFKKEVGEYLKRVDDGPTPTIYALDKQSWSRILELEV